MAQEIMMMFPGSRAAFSHPVVGRRGFILPVVMVLVSLMLILGWSYLSSSLHSKNISNIFFRDDLARLIAESASAEWKAGFSAMLANRTDLQTLFSAPGGATNLITLTNADFPQTVALADSIAGNGQVQIHGFLTLKDIDQELKEGTIAVKFPGEYQATLRLDFTIVLGSYGRTRMSRFVYEHDVKRANMRSTVADRRQHLGYSAGLTNDYLLYIRNALGEFDRFNGSSLNNNQKSLVLLQPNPGKQGRLFFGCARPSEADQEKKFVFLNIDKDLADMIPQVPPTVNIPWADLQAQMPIFAAKINAAIDKARQEAQGQCNFFPERITSQISLDFKPMAQDNSLWWQSLLAKIRDIFNTFIARVTGKDRNVDKGIQIFGNQTTDKSMCSQVEGNLRQRFWQTATFKLDFSNLTDKADVNQAIVDECRKNGTKLDIDVQYFTANDIAQMPAEQKEFCTMIQTQETKSLTLLTSRGNDQYAFKPNQRFDERNPVGKFPDLKNWAGKTDYAKFLPYASYLLRSYMFEQAGDLLTSSLVETDANGTKIIHLNGIIGITHGQLVIPDGMKYQGQGVILSCAADSPVPIVVQGDFSPVDPAQDFCALYTWSGNIKLNAARAGKVVASLIALSSAYNGTTESKMCMVDFSNQKAEIHGNLVADRLNLNSMGNSLANSISYNPERLYGEKTEYSVFVGGRLRSFMSVFDQPNVP